jgi:uncharacterized repeat protein (TIGR03803 family)
MRGMIRAEIMGKTTKKRELSSRLAALMRVAFSAVLAVGLLSVVAAAGTGQKFKALYTFSGGADGGTPTAPLVQDAAGNLYGTTESGGTGLNGTVFKLDPRGKEKVLHNFTGGVDGGSPWAGLVLDSQGNLYGTTFGGGNFNCGVIFKLSKTGKETVLYSFTGGSDGRGLFAGLVLDTAGNLFGAAAYGGASNYGAVFKLDTSGQFNLLHTFVGGADGEYPYSGLFLDQAGNLYGTTYGGGTSSAGTVFMLDKTGKETVLYSFTGRADGASPWGSLVRDGEGNLYGTAFYGGVRSCQAPYGCGVVFRLDTTGKLKVLHKFTGGDGANPTAGVALDDAGNLYGTTNRDGDRGCSEGGCGTIFKLSPAGKEKLLHTFTGKADGANPWAGLLWDAKGQLCGTTYGGGGSNAGVVFRLDP